MKADVIVVGSGAAGLAAALAASAAGASVVILERANLIGGTTAYSGGVVWAPLSGYANGIAQPDSRDDALRYLESEGIGDSDRRLCEEYVDRCGEVLAAISSLTPISWHMIDWPDYHEELPGGRRLGRSLELEPLRAGADVERIIRDDPRNVAPVTYDESARGLVTSDEIASRRAEGIMCRGRGLAAGLYIGAVDAGVDIRLGVRARALIMRGGEVVGLSTDEGDYEGRVVLASGGFERNEELVRTFLTGRLIAPGGAPGLEGDALRMAMQAGAALGNMNEAWWCPAISVPGMRVDDAPYHWSAFSEKHRPGGIVVDGRGQRFANEGTNYNDFGRALMAFDPGAYTFPRVPSWLVFDSVRRATSSIGPIGPKDPDASWMYRAETLEELGSQLGFPPGALAETVTRFNAHAEQHVDPDFHRGESYYEAHSLGLQVAADALKPITAPPFYAVELRPGCLGTKGGPRTDHQGRVLRADGKGAIPGLFAAGNAAANPFGYGYPGGGGTIGPALVFGWLAGTAAAKG